jgi:hypothetical protein
MNSGLFESGGNRSDSLFGLGFVGDRFEPQQLVSPLDLVNITHSFAGALVGVLLCSDRGVSALPEDYPPCLYRFSRGSRRRRSRGCFQIRRRNIAIRSSSS